MFKISKKKLNWWPKTQESTLVSAAIIKLKFAGGKYIIIQTTNTNFNLI
jgi:hypothetical protein